MLISSYLLTRSFSSTRLTPRHSTNTVLWCAEGSSTYVTINPGIAIVGDAVFDLRSDAYDALNRHIENRGDGIVQGGTLVWKSITGISIRTWNTNNHQQTYGVLAAALCAVADYMRSQYFGAITFWIFDGTNEFGKGVID